MSTMSRLLCARHDALAEACRKYHNEPRVHLMEKKVVIAVVGLVGEDAPVKGMKANNDSDTLPAPIDESRSDKDTVVSSDDGSLFSEGSNGSSISPVGVVKKELRWGQPLSLLLGKSHITTTGIGNIFTCLIRCTELRVLQLYLSTLRGFGYLQ